MIKFLRRFAILLAVFLAASALYLIAAWNHTEQSETVYTSMEDPSLPVVYAEMFGEEYNRLAGYRQEMNSSVARDALTILPEDRRLRLHIREFGVSPLAIGYDIRSLDGERLVERTELESWSSGDGQSIAVLPIQNLLNQGTEYLLHVQMETEQHGQIHYYTRILLPENDYARQMLDLAKDFSVRTLDETAASDLVTYLETTSTADNSSLGHVTLESSFSQITWAGLDMILNGDMEVTLRELDGIMGQICVAYQLSHITEEGQTELYDVTDYYTMRWDERRIYLMDFERTANQVFAGTREQYSGKRILLGIGNDDAAERLKSNNGRYLAFEFNRDLWCYDQSNSNVVKVFSFRSDTDESGRSGYDHHGIKILSVDDEGNMDFMVYGYMNRGVHEGEQGISVCRFEQGRNGSIEELFFVPSEHSFEEIRQDVLRLSYLSPQNMLYLYRDRAVFGIDLSSNEYMVVAQNLTEGSYAISEDKKWIAWQEKQSEELPDEIHVLSLETGVNQSVRAPQGVTLRTLGFVQGDFVYGMARTGEEWILNGRVVELPMYALEIVDSEMEVQTRYEQEGYCVANVSVEEARVHMDKLINTGTNTYEPAGSDTIVCNVAAEETYMEGIGWYASETHRKVYFIQLDQDVSQRGARVSVARRISYDRSSQLILGSVSQPQGMLFYAYARGKLQGIYSKFCQAAAAAYDQMGMVTDQYQRIIWDRVNRGNIRNLREPQTLAYDIVRYMGEFTDSTVTDSGMLLLDARGAGLRQVLYFIGQGYPVLAYVEQGDYLLLYGYDQYNVSICDPNTGNTWKMGINDAENYFSGFGNDFICGRIVKN